MHNEKLKRVTIIQLGSLLLFFLLSCEPKAHHKITLHNPLPDELQINIDGSSIVLKPNEVVGTTIFTSCVEVSSIFRNNYIVEKQKICPENDGFLNLGVGEYVIHPILNFSTEKPEKYLALIEGIQKEEDLIVKKIEVDSLWQPKVWDNTLGYSFENNTDTLKVKLSTPEQFRTYIRNSPLDKTVRLTRISPKSPTK